MKEYFIVFYQDYKPDDDEGIFSKDIKKGDVINVTETEMFRCIEKAHTEKILISVYSAIMVCDLS